MPHSFCRRYAARCALSVCMAIAVVASAGSFGSEPAAPLLTVEQPAQPLADALRAIARQAGVSIVFDPVIAAGRMAKAVRGRLTAADAVAQALEGTGLVVQSMPDGSLVVKTSSATAPSPAGFGARTTELEKVDITGTRLTRIDREGPAPVHTYTREDIERSGQPTLERFLSSLNEVSMAQGEGAFSITLGQGTVQLRGLPLGSTLVLINGRRVEAVGSSSADFFNLNLIPTAAIERVDIVPVGSSAVYGGDALAGVVNVILKRSLDGTSLSAGLGSGKRFGDGSFSLAHGGTVGDGTYLLLGSYRRQTPLYMGERGFFRDADYRRFGGTDARSRSCTPGTVSSSDGSNLPGLTSSFAGIPSNRSGAALQPSDFASGAGQANLCGPYTNGNGYALAQGEETVGLHALGDQRLVGSWTLFGEATLARDRLFADETGLSVRAAVVPASNPYNPFGQPVSVTAALGPDNGLKSFHRTTSFARALLGLRGDLVAGWDAELTVSTTRDRSRRVATNSDIDADALAAALGSSSTASALNPFTAGRAASDAVLRGIFLDSYRQSRGSKDQATAFVRGDALTLPAGPVQVIAGGEFARDQYRDVSTGNLPVDVSRTEGAVFAEARAPLVRAKPASGPAWDLAALTVAGRRDRYSDFGSASTYQGGLEVRPMRGLLVRGSMATSFKPPTLLQTNVDDSAFPAELFGLTDPARGNEPITDGQVVRTANPNLTPERARAFSLGALWESEASPGTRLGLTVWRVKINNLISILLPQTALDNEGAFPGFVQRGPSTDGGPGPVTRINYAEANFGGIRTAGIDLDASHTFRTSFGRGVLAASATRTTEYEVVLAPGVAADDRLGRRAYDYWAPRWKGRVSAGWEQGAWSLGVTSRYLGRYQDSPPSDQKLGDYWIHDLSGALDLKRLGLGLGGLKAATLTAAIVNVGNRQPQFIQSAPYYDVTQADWRGRYASVRLGLDW